MHRLTHSLTEIRSGTFFSNDGRKVNTSIWPFWLVLVGIIISVEKWKKMK